MVIRMQYSNLTAAHKLRHSDLVFIPLVLYVFTLKRATLKFPSYIWIYDQIWPPPNSYILTA